MGWLYTLKGLQPEAQRFADQRSLLCEDHRARTSLSSITIGVTRIEDKGGQLSVALWRVVWPFTRIVIVLEFVKESKAAPEFRMYVNDADLLT